MKETETALGCGLSKTHGTLMTVFTIVTGPTKTIAQPFTVVIAATPAVEIDTPF